MRAFISIELPEEIKDELVRVQSAISKINGWKGKIVERENLHLTLKFLGEIDDKKVADVEERLKQLEFDKVKVNLGELGVFSENFIRIVWVSLEDGELKNLQRAVDSLLDGLFDKEERFMGHITIVRPKFVEDKECFLRDLKKIIVGKKEFIVDRVFLRESLLSKRGSEYSDVLVIKGE